MNNDPKAIDISGEDIGYLIWRIYKIWQRGKLKILDEFNLTGPQLELLGAVYHMSELNTEITQIVLSQVTDIDPMTTSTILRNLEKKGLIERKESKTDTRARLVEITKEGADIFSIAIFKVKNAQKTLMKNIDEQSLKTQLQNLLKEIEQLEKKINNY